MGINACIEAINLGSIIIEKHFTLNSNNNFGDHRFSADPNLLKILTDYNKYKNEYLGNGNIFPSKSELKFSKIYRKGIYLKNDVLKGNILKRK